jgi:hypothetical protein
MKGKCIIVLCFVLLAVDLRAHEQIVHQAITVNAAQAAISHSLGFEDFASLVSSDRSLKQATNLMVLGSFEEDDDAKRDKVGGNRSYNHFYDPVYTVDGRGLSEIPPDIRGAVGLNSFTWGSISNCTGYNFHSLLFGIGGNVHTTNIWSWPNARGYEWLGLTATNQSERQANLDNMFRAIGQVMHLLEDASQPQHVRNEQHLYPYTNWITTKLDPFISPIEKYGQERVDKLNYGDGSMLDWRGDGFSKLEDFWDRHLYAPGNAAALNNAEERGGTQLGLAEWCNGNFLGDRHSYAEFFYTNSIKYYPHPALADTTFNINPYNNHGISIAPTTLDSGKIGDRAYVSKTGAGVPVEFHSALTYLAVKHPPRLNLPGMEIGVTIRDDNVLSNYHDLFIPKAVKYSAGLIDYYFRGTISAQITDYDTNTMQYTVSVENTSFQDDFAGGTFSFYQDTNGVRTLATNVAVSSLLPSPSILASGDSISMNVPGPLPTNGQFVCVYQGNIGVDENGNALDPVDTNIAIAATIFNDHSIIFDLTCDNSAEVDFYLIDPCGVTNYEPDIYHITSPCCKVDGGDAEGLSHHQHMVVSDITDGRYTLWANYEADDGNGDPVNCTLVTTSASIGVLTTNTFTLNTHGSGANGQYWPVGVSGPATVDINGVQTTTNASWYVQKTITISNGIPVSY